MKLSTEQLENCQIVLNVEVEPLELEKYLEEAYHHLAETYKIPGFRKGKAPRPIIERYLGKGALLEHALEHLVPDLSSKAIEEQKIAAIAYPDIEITELEPVKFKATIPVQPIVELGDYRSIAMTPEAVEISAKDIDTTMEQLRVQKAVWEPVIRAITLDDMVKIDVKSVVNGKTALDEKDRYYVIQKDSPLPLPGFAEQLIGMDLGQTKEFHLTYPSDYDVKDLAGKDYGITVTVHEIKEKHLPDVTDDFARGIAEGITNVDTLRQRLQTNLQSMAESNSRRAFEDRIIEQIAKISKVYFPPIMVEQETGRFLADMAQQFGGGETGLNTFLKSSGKTLDEIKNQIKPAAESKITRSLILGKVADDAKLSVTDEEVNSRLEEIVKSDSSISEDIKKALESPSGRETTRQLVLAQKTFQYLVDIVTNMNTKETADINAEKVPVESEGKQE